MGTIIPFRCPRFHRKRCNKLECYGVKRIQLVNMDTPIEEIKYIFEIMKKQMEENIVKNKVFQSVDMGKLCLDQIAPNWTDKLVDDFKDTCTTIHNEIKANPDIITDVIKEIGTKKILNECNNQNP